MVSSFEETFLRRLKEQQENIKTRLATGSVSGVEQIYELRGRAQMLDWVMQEFRDVIEGYKHDE